MAKELELIIRSRERDIGGFSVRRLLPYASHRMVGPFIFFDHMGPAEFAPGEGMDVRPHPHIGLATVTYLFEGAILHRDSLGSERVIEPGAINWMTAGRGIVHSERTPPERRKTGGRVHGLQCWVALPAKYEELEPSFAHHPGDTLPVKSIGGARIQLLLGDGFGMKSPVVCYSDIIYADIMLEKNARLEVPGGSRELAAYVVEGSVTVGDEVLGPCSMAVAVSGGSLTIEASERSRLMLLGGEALEGERFIFWNLVSSSRERIERAKTDWAQGRFPKVPGDEVEFIPLPAEPAKGTIL